LGYRRIKPGIIAASRIWWSEVGVSQNLTHAVHPDPASGVHCWLQKATVHKAGADEKVGDVFVGINKSMQKYHEWLAMNRPADKVNPDGNRRPYWLTRLLKPTKEVYQ
jgi:hypothetical protein